MGPHSLKGLVVGGGPAGLAAAALLARRIPGARIDLVERTARDHSHGYGITLRDYALDLLDLHRLLPPRALTGRRVLWNGAALLHLPPPPVDTLIVPLGRDELIRALITRCLEHGVNLRWGVGGEHLDAAALACYDLVVAADGAGSALRTRHATELGVDMRKGRNHFGWFVGATPFPEMTILMEQHPVPLMAWAYQYDAEHSSFIVEVGDRGHAQLCAAHDAPAAMAQAVSACFALPAPLRSDGIPWRRFNQVRCSRLHLENLVLIGDAAHTTHFSQGFGTLFAFDDALALVDALNGSDSVGAALETYERMQLPKIRQFQDVAQASQRWSEDLVTALEDGDVAGVRALIAARWGGNSIGPAPSVRSISPASV